MLRRLRNPTDCMVSRSSAKRPRISFPVILVTTITEVVVNSASLFLTRATMVKSWLSADVSMERNSVLMEELVTEIPALNLLSRPVLILGTLPVTISDVFPRPGCVTEMMTVLTIVMNFRTALSPPVVRRSGNVLLEDAFLNLSSVILTMTVETFQVKNPLNFLVLKAFPPDDFTSNKGNSFDLRHLSVKIFFLYCKNYDCGDFSGNIILILSLFYEGRNFCLMLQIWP